MTKGTPRLVVLEDNEEDFSIVQIACQQFARPIELVRFRRGEELAEQVAEDKLTDASLFLLDLRMPGGGGMLALNVIRSKERYRHIPVLIYTASNNPVEVQRCYRNQVTAFHIKQIETPESLKLLSRIFGYWFDDCVLAFHRRDVNDR